MEMAIDWKVMKGLGYSDYFAMIEGLDLDAVAVNQVLYLLGLRRWASRIVKTYTDEWGVKRRFTGELLPFPVDHPVRTMENLAAYRPPDPAVNPLLKAIRLAKKKCPNRAVVMLTRAVFAASWYLVGLENLLISYITNPVFARTVSDMMVSYCKILIDLAVEAGVDVIILTDDYAHKTGGLMSPDQFRELVLPGFQEVVDEVKMRGAYCIKHTDGNIWEMIDPIVGTGIHGLGPLEPAAGMNLREVKDRYGGNLCLVGNVDVDLLSRGTPAEITSVVVEKIRHLAPGGGYCLGSSNSIPDYVPIENYRAMVETALEYGKYRNPA